MTEAINISDIQRWFMLNFKFFLLERASGIFSHNLGNMHEILVHKILNNNEHPSPDSKTEHDKIKSYMSDSEYESAVNRAHNAASYIKTNIIGKNEVSKIERTNTGVAGESQHENPSDLVLHFKSGEKHGISLKASGKANAKVPSANPGLGTIAKAVNAPDVHGIVSKSRSEFYKQHAPHLASSTSTAQKAGIRADEKLKAAASEEGNKALNTVAHHIANKFDNMKSEDKADIIRTHVLRLPKSKFNVSKVTTSGVGEKTATSHETGNEYDNILADHKNIKTRVAGNTIFFHHPEHGNFASLRFKPDSEHMSGPIKGSGVGLK